jgi:hypothetical protein
VCVVLSVWGLFPLLNILTRSSPACSRQNYYYLVLKPNIYMQ